MADQIDDGQINEYNETGRQVVYQVHDIIKWQSSAKNII